MSFQYKESISANQSPVLRTVIIDNDDDIEVGDAIKVYNAGNAEKSTSATPIFGIVHAIVDKNGLSLVPELTTKAATGSSSTSSGVVTVASDNETVDLISVVVDCSERSIYSGTVDGTIGITATSAKQGPSFDLTDENSIDESSASRSAQGQLYSWGTDPENTSNLLVSIMESERLAGAGY